uniref:Putative replication protein VP4 n=1 Tax=uncultured virus TaxID=340016 RepID=A0A1D8MK60_9VIRU|nr:putative replication protein VP4 [uncultured virus]
MLEAAQYVDNTFVTLTYDDEHLPTNQSVSPQALSSFVKRHRASGYKFRYFGVGEYGENTMRPHYHLAMFGHSNCLRGITRVSRSQPVCCPVCESIKKSWGQGQIMLGTLEPQSMAYVAGYVVKKMTRDDDPRLEGRLPEFARMSLRPGIGLGMMHELASTLLEHKLDEKMIDVPLALQHGNKKFPLGRYLRRKLRTFVGRSPDCPPAVLDNMVEELRPMREAAFMASEKFSQKILEKSLGKRIQIEARQNRFGKKGSI